MMMKFFKKYNVQVFFVLFSMCICCLFIVGLILYANINDIYLKNYINNEEKIMEQMTNEMNGRIDLLVEQMAHIENSEEFKNIVNVTEKIQAGEHVLLNKKDSMTL